MFFLQNSGKKLLSFPGCTAGIQGQSQNIFASSVLRHSHAVFNWSIFKIRNRPLGVPWFYWNGEFLCHWEVWEKSWWVIPVQVPALSIINIFSNLSRYPAEGSASPWMPQWIPKEFLSCAGLSWQDAVCSCSPRHDRYIQGCSLKKLQNQMENDTEWGL